MLTRQGELNKSLVLFYVILLFQMAHEMILVFSDWEKYRVYNKVIIMNRLVELFLLAILMTVACKCRSEKSSATQLSVILLFNLIQIIIFTVRKIPRISFLLSSTNLGATSYSLWPNYIFVFFVAIASPGITAMVMPLMVVTFLYLEVMGSKPDYTETSTDIKIQ